MPFRPVVLFATALVVVVFFDSSPAFSAGPVHGAKGAAMGTAFAAVADDPSAIAHNSAGLGFQNGSRIYSGGTGVTSQTLFRGADGSSEKSDFQIFFPPHLYASSDLHTDTVAIGLGIFSPFGIGGRKWSEEGAFRYISTESYIATLAVNPVFAWRPIPALSLAAGVNYLWTLNRMEKMVDQSLLASGDGKMRFDGDGDGWGWNLGLLWRVTDQVRVGAAYRSSIDVDLTGKIDVERIAPALQSVFGGSSFTTGATMRVTFPPIVTFGIAWQWAPSWTLVAEAEWSGWSTFDHQRICIQNRIPAAGVDDIEISLDWEDSWIFKLGAEYRMTNRLALRSGYAYVTSPVPERTLAPSNPDAEQHYITLGAGYTVGRLTIDAFYSFGLYKEREVNNDITSGTYSTDSHFLGISLGWSF